jgi:hypothetical protein
MLQEKYSNWEQPDSSIDPEELRYNPDQHRSLE